MDDVGTHDEKAAAAEADKAVTAPKDAASTDSPAGETGRGTTATVTKPARPKTAAEIVAEQRAREKAAAEAPAAAAGTGAAGSEDAATGTGNDAAGKDPAETSVTTPVGRVPSGATTKAGASGNKQPTSKSAAGSSGKGKQALSSVGSGVRQVRNLLASLIWLVAVLAAAVLALGALFTALDQTNQSNEIVRWVLERGHDLVGPFKDLFRLETAKNTLLVNWGIAALVYLIVGKIVERFVRP